MATLEIVSKLAAMTQAEVYFNALVQYSVEWDQ